MGKEGRHPFATSKFKLPSNSAAPDPYGAITHFGGHPASLFSFAKEYTYKDTQGVALLTCSQVGESPQQKKIL